MTTPQNTSGVSLFSTSPLIDCRWQITRGKAWPKDTVIGKKNYLDYSEKNKAITILLLSFLSVSNVTTNCFLFFLTITIFQIQERVFQRHGIAVQAQQQQQHAKAKRDQEKVVVPSHNSVQPLSSKIIRISKVFEKRVQ